MVFVFFLILIASAAACHSIARKRGVSPVFWGSMGFVFGPLAVPFVFFSTPSAQNTLSQK